MVVIAVNPEWDKENSYFVKQNDDGYTWTACKSASDATKWNDEKLAWSIARILYGSHKGRIVVIKPCADCGAVSSTPIVIGSLVLCERCRDARERAGVKDFREVR